MSDNPHPTQPIVKVLSLQPLAQAQAPALFQPQQPAPVPAPEIPPTAITSSPIQAPIQVPTQAPIQAPIQDPNTCPTIQETIDQRRQTRPVDYDVQDWEELKNAIQQVYDIGAKGAWITMTNDFDVPMGEAPIALSQDIVISGNNHTLHGAAATNPAFLITGTSTIVDLNFVNFRDIDSVVYDDPENDPFAPDDPDPTLTMNSVQCSYSTLSSSAIHLERANLNLGNGTFWDLNAQGGVRGAAIGLDTGNLLLEHTGFQYCNAQQGGAVWVGGDATILDECSFHNNRANDQGGALYVLGTLTIDNAHFEGNEAGAGGAIECHNGGTIVGTQFLSNRANRDGGAIFADGQQPLRIVQCVFDDNAGKNAASKIGNGGAIASRAPLIIEQSEIRNSASAEGGAIYANAGLVLSDSIIENNRGNYGGAIGAGMVASTNTQYLLNSANGGGGAIYCGHIETTNDTYRENTANGNGGAVYAYSGGTFLNDLFEQNSADNGGGVYINARDSEDGANLIQNSAFHDNSARGNGGAVGYPLEALTKIRVVASPGDFRGNTAGKEVFLEGLDYNDYLMYVSLPLGTGETAGSGSSEYLWNNLDLAYRVFPRITLVAQKVLKNTTESLEAGEFLFGLYSSSGSDPIATTTNAADGTITFEDIRWTEEYTTSHYFVKEIDQHKAGWVADPKRYNVRVVVQDTTGDQNYVATPSFPNGNTIVNARINPPQIKGKVLGIGTDANHHTYHFGLYDANDTLLSVTSNTATGDILFGNLDLSSAPGEQRYFIRRITEESGDGGGEEGGDGGDTGRIRWTPTDDIVFPVDVAVRDFDGDYVTQVNYPNGFPTFYEEQTTPGVSLNYLGDLTFDQPGVYVFTVRETTPSNDEWQTDSRRYQVVVTVVDDGYGNLIATVEYPDGFPEFVNTKKASVTLTAVKTVSGAPLQAGKFHFGVYDRYDNLIGSATNDENGNIVFDGISFDYDGDYEYILKELDVDGEGWTIDRTEYPVTIHVVRNPDGSFSSEVEYTSNVNGDADYQPSFHNVYATNEVAVPISFNKTAIGAPLEDGMFEFGVYDDQGNEILSGVNGPPSTYTGDGGVRLYPTSTAKIQNNYNPLGAFQYDAQKAAEQQQLAQLAKQPIQINRRCAEQPFRGA